MLGIAQLVIDVWKIDLCGDQMASKLNLRLGIDKMDGFVLINMVFSGIYMIVDFNVYLTRLYYDSCNLVNQHRIVLKILWHTSF